MRYTVAFRCTQSIYFIVRSCSESFHLLEFRDCRRKVTKALPRIYSSVINADAYVSPDLAVMGRR